MSKEHEYALKIVETLNQLFNEDSEVKIDLQDFNDDANATAFFHALANLAPAFIYQRLTESRVDALEFNHIANKLVFQFAKKEDDQSF
jgi:hypothetical protein